MSAYLLMRPTQPSEAEIEAQRKREAAFQAIVDSYSKELKPGMTRKEVEDYFRGKKVEHHRFSRIEPESPWTTLVKIGEDKEPWYCSEHYVYAAFQFEAVKPPHQKWNEDESVVLRKITVFHLLGGCL